MEKLTNHKLLIDNNCPMCVAYSGVFVKLNALDKNGPVNYSTAPEYLFNYINADRARNEIALYNEETKEVTYGIHSMIRIISGRFPFLKSILTNPIILSILTIFYRFISYNRKVVIPVNSVHSEKRICNPGFNAKYRISFMVVLGLLSNIFLYLFLKEITFYQQAGGTYLEELTLLILQFVWHGVVIYAFGHKDKIYDYLGQLTVVLFVGGVLLIALKTIFALFSVTNSFIWFGGLGVTALFMLIMLYRRCQKIGEPNHVILAWFTFRVFVSAWWLYEWGILETILKN